MHAKTIYGVLRGSGDRRMRRQAQIILRGEVHTGRDTAGIVANLAARRRTAFGGAWKGPRATLTANVLPRVKSAAAIEEIWSFLGAEVPHAALESFGRNPVERMNVYQSAVPRIHCENSNIRQYNPLKNAEMSRVGPAAFCIVVNGRWICLGKICRKPASIIKALPRNDFRHPFDQRPSLRLLTGEPFRPRAV